MKTVGLFVGLSRQADPRIRALGHGHHDAEALHAVFSDANASVGVSEEYLHLLMNEAATVSAVRNALSRIVSIAQGGDVDLLVVHLSCHGGPSGELALYDAEVGRIPETGLPVAEVVHAITSVDNITVVMTLDCCFSGTVLGMAESHNRNAFNSFMAFTGDSRFVAWASDPGQPAYEDVSLAHGYLSYALLHALAQARARGVTELRIVDWLTAAVGSVEQLADRAGRVQQAGCYAMLSSPASVVITPVGANQRRLAEQAGVVSVTGSLESLRVYGFADAEITSIRGRIGEEAT